MEQIVGERQDEQRNRRGIEASFNIAVFDKTSVQIAGLLHEDAFLGLCEGEENIVFAVQEDEIQSVLQLTPCVASMRRNPRLKKVKHRINMSDIERVKTNRISVATTKTQYRQKGYMGRLIAGSLEYQQQLKIPFCFVESGNKNFWEHFGFAYIYDRPQYELNKELISQEALKQAVEGKFISLPCSDVVLHVVDHNSILSLAHFVNANLCQYYGLFIIRSALYFEHFQRELELGGGNLFEIIENGKMKGYFAYTGDACIREAVFADDADRERFLCIKEEKKPAVMARIVNLSEMMRHIAGNGKITVAIKLTDPVLENNNGVFLWYIDENGSRMERVEQQNNDTEASARPEVTTTIGEFTAFIFEYIQLKQNAKFDSIYLSGPVWMNERYYTDGHKD